MRFPSIHGDKAADYYYVMIDGECSYYSHITEQMVPKADIDRTFIDDIEHKNIHDISIDLVRKCENLSRLIETLADKVNDLNTKLVKCQSELDRQLNFIDMTTDELEEYMQEFRCVYENEQPTMSISCAFDYYRVFIKGNYIYKIRYSNQNVKKNSIRKDLLNEIEILDFNIFKANDLHQLVEELKYKLSLVVEKVNNAINQEKELSKKIDEIGICDDDIYKIKKQDKVLNNERKARRDYYNKSRDEIISKMNNKVCNAKFGRKSHAYTNHAEHNKYKAHKTKSNIKQGPWYSLNGTKSKRKQYKYERNNDGTYNFTIRTKIHSKAQSKRGGYDGNNYKYATLRIDGETLLRHFKVKIEEISILKKLNICNKDEWKKWLLINHVDKGGDEDICKRVISEGRSHGW